MSARSTSEEKSAVFASMAANPMLMVNVAVPFRFVQFIDVRDAADFMVHLCEAGRSAIYDVTGEPQTTTIQAFVATADGTLATAVATRGDTADVRWIAEPFLEAHGVTGWMDLALWIGLAAGLPGFMNVHRSCARRQPRVPALATTSADTREWSRVEPAGSSTPSRAGLTRDRERELLAAWAAASAPRGT